MTGSAGAAEAARRAEQTQLYGAPVGSIVASIGEHVGLDLPGVAATIGVSVPMLTRLHDAQRVRLGNQVAMARLQQLGELADHVASGVADPADTALAIAQIAASSGLSPSRPTAVVLSTPSGVDMAGTGLPTLTRAALQQARDRVSAHVGRTPSLRWPLLEQATGTATWVKHENHAPTGAFKVRGGLNHLARLLADGPVAGLVAASRGNHSQSLAYAGRAHGVPVVVVVPEGNSPAKNAAARALGAELVVHGRDFHEALEHARVLAGQRDLVLVPSYHPWLVEGVATYAAELHEDVPDLDVVYVPVGMGSGICANIWVRDLLGAHTEVVGVVAAGAPAYALSFAAGSVVSTPSADTIVDGVACRTPDPDAVSVILGGAARVLQVSDEQARVAMALMYDATHNLSEPAGSLALAGLLSERERVVGRRVAVVHTGGNADFDVLALAMSRRA